VPISHILLALAVVAVWGTNFVVIKFGLTELPPLLLATLRFALSALPWLLFIKRPAVAWRYLVAYGVFIGFMFGLLFLAMRADVSPGLASLLMQSQVFMTLLLVAWLQHERMPRVQFGGLALATLGFALIAWQSFSQAHSDVTPLGLALALGGALCWACGNVLARSIGKVDMLGFMVWSSVFAVPPLLVLSLCAGTPPGRHHHAHGPADSRLRHGLLGPAAGRTIAGLEARRRRTRDGRTGDQRAGRARTRPGLRRRLTCRPAG
jgi:O-acetylserine/cysteine efflux transporter